MAVAKIPQTTRLIVKVQTGVNTAGNPVCHQRTYNNVKVSAVDGDLYAIGQGLGGLQKYPVVNIIRTDEGNLMNQ